MSKNKCAPVRLSRDSGRLPMHGEQTQAFSLEDPDARQKPKPASEIEATAVLSYARGKDGRIAIMLEVDGKVTRGGPELKSKRDATITLYRAVADLKRVVDAPVGRGRR